MDGIKKLSDLTGNPWDDLTARQQRNVMMRLSARTYATWTAASPSLVEIIQRKNREQREQRERLDGVFRKFLRDQERPRG